MSFLTWTFGLRFLSHLHYFFICNCKTVNYKMYVYWKTLLVLGVTLWILLCITDILYEDYGSKKYLSTGNFNLIIATSWKLYNVLLDEFSWTRDVPEEELIYTPPKITEMLEISESDLRGESTFGFGFSLIFWNCIAFLSSIVLCSLLRNGALLLIKRYFERM